MRVWVVEWQLEFRSEPDRVELAVGEEVTWCLGAQVDGLHDLVPGLDPPATADVEEHQIDRPGLLVHELVVRRIQVVRVRVEPTGGPREWRTVDGSGVLEEVEQVDHTVGDLGEWEDGGPVVAGFVVDADVLEVLGAVDDVFVEVDDADLVPGVHPPFT